MNFSTLEFALFFPLALLLFSATMSKERWRDLSYLIVSYLFYMAWYWEYAGLLALSTMVDYFLALGIARSTNEARRKFMLISSLALNLGVLAVFKYFNFFTELSTNALSLFGYELALPRSDLLLPVGISFYTFQSLSYTIDVYRRSIPAEPNFTKFAVFVSFFPQLVAGPIVRASDFLPQLRLPVSVDRQMFNRGLALLFVGLFKKVIIADTLASLAVDAVFAAPTAYSSWDLLLAIYAYAFQIYCDFSGYSDMAIGCAAMMGFWLPDNFNRPYLALNIRDFWTRWHISLSSWLKDYLYISLGGNRGTAYKTFRNLTITMLLGGLWHGAALNFVLWGAWHGLLLGLSRKQDRHAAASNAWKNWCQRVICFHLVCFGWLLFRVNGWQQFSDFVVGLSHLSFGTKIHAYVYFIIALAFAMHAFPKTLQMQWVLNDWPQKAPRWAQASVYALLLIVTLGFSLDSPAFIYFQF